MNSAQFDQVFNAMLKSLGDYSTDQRGDVGSWIRVAGVDGLGQAIAVASQQPEPQELISTDKFQAAIGGIVKLGMEKLEPVRAASWRTWRLLHDVHAGSVWKWEGDEVWDFEAKDNR